jgi:hypothetical protein
MTACIQLNNLPIIGVRIQIGIGLGPDFAALAAKQQQQPTIEPNQKRQSL